jgi:3-hydroxyisobutyrate dehydrogenase-like beta-hydroxyacid dehydrogenase
MSEISVIGLGSMGTALAKALQSGSAKVTVWNRTATKMLPLVGAGAHGASSPAAAVQASPIILICVENYPVTQRIMGESDVIPRLSGKTIIQLSTGTPREAREANVWFKNCGATYIDGAIMEFPVGIGTPTTKILFAGPQDTFASCAATISPLGGGLKYIGPNIGAAAALDLALLSKHIGMVLGVIHGALVCRSENVGIDSFAGELSDEHATALADLIHSNKFSDPGCPIDVWFRALQRIQTQACDAGISSDIPDFMVAIFKRAIGLGFGNQDIAAIFEALHRSERG